MTLDYQTTIGIVTIFIVVAIMIGFSVIDKPFNSNEIFINYGKPDGVDCEKKDSLFQLIMLTKHVDKRGKDCDVMYGTIENKFAYVAISQQYDLEYGKFYDCYVYTDELGDIVSMELKGEIA